MNPLLLRLRDRIARDGPLSVAEFMDAALGDADHGYYRRRQPLGAAGDFITAPEISQMFGELIGLWCARVWDGIGRPDPVLLVELGPGRGTLLADALRACAKAAPAFRAALRVHLVEASPVLRESQRNVIGTSATWHERLDTVPAAPMILIANEFFDALPIRQFVRREGGWFERQIALAPKGDGLCFAIAPEPATDLAHSPWRDAACGAVLETAPERHRLASAIAERIRDCGGAALIVDYGSDGAVGDTLQAVRRHRPADPLSDPGETDLTAHVDFAALKRAAGGVGARCFGPVPQGLWLNRLGIVARAAQLVAATPGAGPAIESACRRLIAPEEMGTLFKVLAVMGSGAVAPPGFDPEPEVPC